MSVAAMTMDDQRPLMNSYDKMSTKYEQNMHIIGGGSGGSVGSGVGVSGGLMGAPPSGPASPTPSGSEEQLPPPSSSTTTTTGHGHSYGHSHSHSTHHHHHHHTQHQHHAVQTQEPQQQQQQHRHNQQQQQQEQQQQQQQHQQAAVAEAVAAAEQRQRLLEDEIESLKLEQTHLGQQFADAQRREKILMRRLANKEQEFQDYVSQIAEYKAQQAPTALALRTALLDPAVNLLFERLKKELKATKAKLEETQNELSAWKFTPDSNTGKRLMAKCRLLYQENEELGKMTSNGRLAKLETELAMQKSFSEEVKKSQSELDDFLQELDEDVEGMQSTILFLQQELKTTRDRIQILEKENQQLKQSTTTTTIAISNSSKEITETSPPATTNGTTSNNNEFKYQQTTTSSTTLIASQTTTAITTTKLEAIEESVEECTTSTTTVTVPPTADYFNGGNEASGAAASELILPDNGENGNSATAVPARLARKRNYEEEPEATPLKFIAEEAPVVAATVPTIREVSAPRTLPPKKSKLRGIATRRSSQLEENVSVPVSAAESTTTQPLLTLDNAVAGMASEEGIPAPGAVGAIVSCVESTLPASAAAAAAVTESSESVAPARILTRRRSVRMQQNGAGGTADY